MFSSSALKKITNGFRAISEDYENNDPPIAQANLSKKVESATRLVIRPATPPPETQHPAPAPTSTSIQNLDELLASCDNDLNEIISGSNSQPIPTPQSASSSIPNTLPAPNPDDDEIIFASQNEPASVNDPRIALAVQPVVQPQEQEVVVEWNGKRYKVNYSSTVAATDEFKNGCIALFEQIKTAAGEGIFSKPFALQQVDTGFEIQAIESTPGLPEQISLVTKHKVTSLFFNTFQATALALSQIKKLYLEWMQRLQQLTAPSPSSSSMTT